MCKQYSAQEALDMGWINTVVPLEQVEDVTMEWAEEMLTKSPVALRMIKSLFKCRYRWLGWNN